MMTTIKTKPNPPLGTYPQCALYGQLGNAPKRNSTSRMITIVRSMVSPFPAGLSCNFRSGPLMCASYPSPTFDRTNCLSHFNPDKISISISTIKTFIRRSNCLRSSTLGDSCRARISTSNWSVKQWSRSEEMDMGPG